MHQTALAKVKAFLASYVEARQPSAGTTVLDVGSYQVQQHANARQLCETAGLTYVGLDVVAGPNVDLVPSQAYVWDCIENESFDFVISSNTFEHNPFFWVTFAEIARVLKQGGCAFVTAPGAGPVHRHPVDCWRFYPDSWAALCTLTGLVLEEAIQEPPRSKGLIGGAHWCDSCAVASKPVFADAEEQSRYYGRLRELTHPYASFGLDIQRPKQAKGPLLENYMKVVARAEAVRVARERAQARRAEAGTPAEVA